MAEEVGMTMIERVARVLYAVIMDAPVCPWEQFPDTAQDNYRGLARAAIAAIPGHGWKLVPIDLTPDMRAAGDGVENLQHQWDCLLLAVADDAALKEAKEADDAA